MKISNTIILERVWQTMIKCIIKMSATFLCIFSMCCMQFEIDRMFVLDTEYHSPIFLDCCGLVRRVMRDLRHDFGFRLGPWNQSYMFDTLPINVAREEDMKPGDLVFISAIYNNPKS